MIFPVQRRATPGKGHHPPFPDTPSHSDLVTARTHSTLIGPQGPLRSPFIHNVLPSCPPSSNPFFPGSPTHHTALKSALHTFTPSMPTSRGQRGSLALTAQAGFTVRRLGAGAPHTESQGAMLPLPTGLSDSASSTLTFNPSYPLSIFLREKKLFKMSAK